MADMSRISAGRGKPLPLGMHRLTDGFNFATFSRHATAMTLQLYNPTARVEECLHLTVRGLAAELAERGYKVSPNTVWSLLRKAGYSFRKTLFASEQDRPKGTRRRAQWKKYQGRLDPRRLVFIDETWAKPVLSGLSASRRDQHDPAQGLVEARPQARR